MNAVQDLWGGIANAQIWLYLAKSDIRGRYRRTVIGPMWTALNALVFVVIIALVYSQFWGQSPAEFLPYVAAGYFVWIFISTCFLEGCGIYYISGAFLKTAPISPIVFNMRVIVRNLIVFAHSLFVYVFIALFAKVSLVNILWVVPGMFLLALFCFAMSVILSVLCSRYRDFEQVVTSVILAAFFVTPILYEASMLGEKTPLILRLNLFTYLIDIVRQPMLGYPPNLQSYMICALATLVALIIALVTYSMTRKRLYLWI